MNYKKYLPKRKKDYHKGDCGRVGIIAGSLSMLGSAILASQAALRSGAGLVYLMTVEEAVPHINIMYPELIVLPLVSKSGVLAFESIDLIKKYHEQKRFDSLGIGPGLTTELSIQKLIPEIMNLGGFTKLPLVLDADALNVLTLDNLKAYPHNKIVVTPHVGEFNRLYGKKSDGKGVLAKTDKSGKERIYYAAELSRKTRQITVLKGHGTVIADELNTLVNNTGNEGMATAGTGDVLTGVITSFLAQGVVPFQAAALGVYLHGLAGDFARKEKTSYSLISSDLLTYLPKAFKTLC